MHNFSMQLYIRTKLNPQMFYFILLKTIAENIMKYKHSVMISRLYKAK